MFEELQSFSGGFLGLHDLPLKDGLLQPCAVESKLGRVFVVSMAKYLLVCVYAYVCSSGAC